MDLLPCGGGIPVSSPACCFTAGKLRLKLANAALAGVSENASHLGTAAKVGAKGLRPGWLNERNADGWCEVRIVRM